jgi:acyl transferase domain-containing protein/3-hydroxymyristoyl/3-hydroxydecanoyl-(acyl carrier protein) dehydratase
MSYEPIAIVGRSVVVPGASSPQALWNLVEQRRSAVTSVPAGRFGLEPDLVAGTRDNSVDRTWSTAGGYVDVDAAAAALGDFPGKADVASLDPLFSWVLGSAHQALVDAGFDAGLRGQRGGAVFGNLSFPTAGMVRLGEELALTSSWQQSTGRVGAPRRDRFMSGLPALLLQQHLGLDAFAYALDAACASSLYAVHLAARALQAGRADVVVAGAVNRSDSLFLHVGFSALQAMSTAGVPRPFDVNADGLVPAEGVCAVTLMRLQDAKREGRPIHGIIVGSALANDGRAKSLLAPSSEGQVRAVASAWSHAGVSPASAGLFECHATGTQTGDRVEVDTLRAVIANSGDVAKAPIPLSSLKSNMGHLITAAGAAGLVKVLEAFKHETLPPSINVDTPIDVIDNRTVRLQQEASRWVRPAGDARRAGVSAFGFGGNDAHVVVEEAQTTRHFSVPDTIRTALPALAVVACAVRLGNVAGGLDVLVGADLEAAHIATDVEVKTTGLRSPPNDLKSALAQQTLILEATRDATAALNDEALPKERTGVFVGMGADMQVTTPGLRFRAEDLLRRRVGAALRGEAFSSTLAQLRDLAMPPMGAAGVLGMMPNIPANRLNVQLDVRGPGFTVSSEEFSGLDALDIARTLIGAGDIDAAIVGAVEAGADSRHLASLRDVHGRDVVGSDVATALVVMAPERAARLGLSVLATIDDDGTRPTGLTIDNDAATGAHAAAGLVDVAQGISQAGGIDVEVVSRSAFAKAPRTLQVRAADNAKRNDVAVMFGPVVGGLAGTSSSWLNVPAVAQALQLWFGDDASAMAAGTHGTVGCERDLFTGSVHMLARAVFVRDVVGIRAGHHIGVSLGESTAFVAANVWQQPRALLDDTVASRIFVDDVAGKKNAVARFWQLQGKEELGHRWSTAVLRAPRAAVVSAVSAVNGDDAVVFITMWHTDDEVEIAGAPDAVAAVAKALNTVPVLLDDAPAVHCPAVSAIGERYRTLHHRQADAAHDDVTLWSNGVGSSGGVLTSPTADACADAILTQASRTVDVPALLRSAWAAGVRTFIDVSPRGLLANWCKRVLPEARVIVVDGEPAAAALALGAAELSDHRRFFSRRTEGAVLRLVAHTEPKPWPEPSMSSSETVERLPLPPHRPRVSLLSDADLAAALPKKQAPVAVPSKPAMTTSQPSVHTVRTPVVAAPAAPAFVAASVPAVTAPAMVSTSSAAPVATGDAAIIDAINAQRAALAQAHASFLQTASAAHSAFLASRARLLDGLVNNAAGNTVVEMAHTAPLHTLTSSLHAPVAAKPVAAPVAAAPVVTRTVKAVKPANVMFDRAELESLATDRISKVLGPVFARQDNFPRQVRMPEPPLLLCDRVLSTTAKAGVLERGQTMLTATDVRADAWYLHEGRVPAGILIETGQADLLLISLMGVDFENAGARSYRLLGCDLTYTAHLPVVGDVLHHTIVIDGFATAAISAESEARIFFFHSDTRLGDENGPVVLQVRNGQAGFFTDGELLNSGGVLWKPTDENAAAIKAQPTAESEVRSTKKSLSHDELLAWADGHAVACFGAGFELCETQVRTPRINGPFRGVDTFGNPDGRAIDMLLVDRVTHLDLDGGPWSRGYLRAEFDLHPGRWFYEGHFKDDPCMPGTVMFEGCLQVASTVLAAHGFIVGRDGFRFEPKLGQQMKLRCRGQATPTSKHMVYEVFVKKIVGGKEPEVHCDILVTVDGLKSLHCADVIVALVADYPLTSRPDLLGIVEKTDGKDAIAPRTTSSSTKLSPVVGFQSLISTGIGRPGAAFPGLYDVYDDGSPVARMPGPPYHFMSAVDEVSGPPMGSLNMGKSAAGTKASVRYDVPADAWYFDEAERSQGGTMPFAVLLEVALQPCGWLSSYAGSTRTSQTPLKYRNLDGTATQHKEIHRDVGALITTATLTKSSSSGGMIIQEFTYAVRDAAGDDVFSGTTVFGFFPQEALERQVGVGSSDADKARLRQSDLPGFPMSFSDEATWQRLAGSRLHLPLLAGAPPLLMLDRIEGAWRTPKGHLGVRTAKDVVAHDWFFKAHFFRDPVQPGSLGIEAIVQGLQFAAAFDDLARDFKNPRFESLAVGSPMTWKYRGQVTPKNKLIQCDVEITDVYRDERGVVVVVDGGLWVDGLRTYLAKGLALRIVEG